MKYNILYTLLILYSHKKTRAQPNELVPIDIYIKSPLAGEWNLDFQGREKVMYTFQGMPTWKDGFYSKPRLFDVGERYDTVHFWHQTVNSFNFEKVRLRFPDSIYIWRCQESCLSNVIYERFEIICPIGQIRVNFQEKCKPCENGYWGESCRNRCYNCRNEKCNNLDGKCECNLRYYGTNCSKTCPGAYYLNSKTQKCTEPCHCFDNNQCEIITGRCHDHKCEVNYYGAPFCDTYCLYGKHCKHSCHCNRNAKCNPRDGSCSTGCSMRYVGYDCSIYCRPGFHGLGCNQRCNCALPDQCNATTGLCVKGGCDDYHFGKYCEKKCEKTSKEPECNRRCFCKEFGPCGPTGKCREGCHNRYYGNECDLTCPPFKYLVNGKCTGKCTCNASISCRVTDGTCVKPKCRIGWFGKNCALKCHCRDPQQCDMDTGYCFDKKCESAQYYGSDCQLSCDGDFYLVDGQCIGICHCLNNAKCNVMDGRCVGSPCAPGYMGIKCHIECKNGYFGTDCNYTCHCKFNLPCDRRNGFCEHGCMYGYTGSGCQTDAGYYELTTHVIVWFFVLAVLLTLAGLTNLFMFQDRLKRKEKRQELIKDLKQEGFEVTGVRRETLTLVGPNQRKSVTLINIKGSQRSLSNITQSGSSRRFSNVDDERYDRHYQNDRMDMSEDSSHSYIEPMKAHKRKKSEESTKRRNTREINSIEPVGNSEKYDYYVTGFERRTNTSDIQNNERDQWMTSSRTRNQRLPSYTDQLQSNQDVIKEHGQSKSHKSKKRRNSEWRHSSSRHQSMEYSNDRADNIVSKEKETAETINNSKYLPRKPSEEAISLSYMD